jgi:hypothetical protein
MRLLPETGGPAAATLGPRKATKTKPTKTEEWSILIWRSYVTVNLRLFASALTCVLLMSPACADGVKIIPSVSGGVKPSGSWSAGARAGDFVFVGGMRGIEPVTEARGRRRSACAPDVS